MLGINPWLCDLYLNHPRLFGGKAYWQISPAVDPAGDNSDGFVDDAEYLGPIAQRVWSEISAVPDIVRWVADPSSFRYLSALYLLRAGDLRLISIWSPSFLSLILETIRTHATALLGDIRTGRISADLRLPKQGDDRHSLALDPLPKRADELEPMLRAASICWKEVWPQLALISCWSDGFASHLVPRILREFCDVPIQGKGLLATEGIVSFPLHGSPDGCVPAINSHFFEFCELEGGTPRLVEELQAGEQYTVVITTGGGLYRYRLHDIVRVVGFSGRLPLLRFVGREQGVSDFFGEKLHESHVSELVTRAFASHPEFALVVCEEFPEGFCYCLILQSPVLSEWERRALLERFEAGLLENIHYRYCRQIGQLGPLRLFYQEQGLERYIAELRKSGIREGNIKPGLLARGQGWVQRLGSVEA